MSARSASLLIVVILASGCGGGGPAEEPRAAVAAWEGEPVFSQPWLRDEMPGNAIAYQRLPNPAALFAAPKGGILGEAMASRANAEAIAAIRDAIVALFADGASAGATVVEIANRVRSPIEFAAIASPRPTLLTAMTMDMRSTGELQTAFALLAEAGSDVVLRDTPDFDGFAVVDGLPLPTVLKFDPADGRLLLLSGQGLDIDAARRIAARLSGNDVHPMHDMEARIDDSGQGLLFWIDLEQALPMAQLFTPAETYAKIEALQLHHVRAAAFGFGIAAGKGRVGIALDLGDARATQPVPIIRNRVAATAVGDPDAVVLLSLPGPDEFKRIERIVLAGLDAEARENWAQLKRVFADEFRFDIERALAAVGPDVVAIFDAAGDFTAVRIRDGAAFDAFVDGLASLPLVSFDRTTQRGMTIHHLRLPDPAAVLNTGNPVEQRLATHLYWTREDDYAYIAEVPQALIDRQRRGAAAPVQAWLQRDQGMDTSASALLLTTRVDKAPRRLYYAYLTMLQVLADLSEAPFDVGSMPTADDLGLAGDGAIGLQVSLADPVVAVELVYDSNPGTVVAGAGTQFAAIGGILAAIAVPAYQDYAIRAQVAEGIELADATRPLIAEHVLATGAFPDADTIAGWDRPTAGRYVSDVGVVPGAGVIVVQYNTPESDEAVRGDARLFIEATMAPGGGVTWTCSGTIEQKHLPAACRGNPLPATVTGGEPAPFKL